MSSSNDSQASSSKSNTCKCHIMIIRYFNQLARHSSYVASIFHMEDVDVSSVKQSH